MSCHKKLTEANEKLSSLTGNVSGFVNDLIAARGSISYCHISPTPCTIHRLLGVNSTPPLYFATLRFYICLIFILSSTFYRCTCSTLSYTVGLVKSISQISRMKNWLLQRIARKCCIFCNEGKEWKRYR